MNSLLKLDIFIRLFYCIIRNISKKNAIEIKLCFFLSLTEFHSLKTLYASMNQRLKKNTL